MTWRQFTTFLWGTAVVLIDAVVTPITRLINRRSK